MLPKIPALLVATLLVSACSKKKPADPITPEPAAPVSDGTRTPPASTDDDAARAERERLERERLAKEAERAERMRRLAEPVHFEYDRSDLTERARQLLDEKVTILRSEPSIRLRIIGHTDERGSDEYNQALGQRRAAAAHRYLTQRGLDSSRFVYVSVGESQPRCTDMTEACWADNRRAEFEIIAQ